MTEQPITLPVRISNSEIQTFKDCRRKWWLSYYRRLKPKSANMTGALALGSRIHEALDMYYSKDIPLLEAHAQLLERTVRLLLTPTVTQVRLTVKVNLVASCLKATFSG